MSTKFYFQSILITNFRAFEELKIDKLRRINIIGGFNGVGKSALLETLFFCLDRKNPLSLLKPLSWRRVEQSGALDPSQFLHDRSNPEATISVTHRGGKNSIVLKYELPPRNVSLSIATSAMPPGFGTTDTNQKGMSIVTSDGSGVAQEEGFILPAQDGAVGNISKTSDLPIPTGQILSLATRGLPQEVAIRLSNIVRQRRIPALLEALRHLVPDLKGLQTLQDGAVPQIYAEIGDDFLPVQFLGDGFQNLFQTVIGIMNAQNGVLFLDEIDAALHYSKISQIWSVIAKMAEAENCQIFATTHSRECINNAAEGVQSAGRASDFQYLRLEKRPAGEHGVVQYDMKDIKQAEFSDVEIR